MKTAHRTIGHSIPRHGAVQRLKGTPIFSADLELEQPLTLKVLRSEKAHARINAIDMTRALQVDGIVRIFTAADIPGKNLVGIINRDQPLLAPEKVRFIGDPIALVAAENEAAAEKALKLIRVDYEELPAVFDPESALKADAPKIHEKGNLLFSRKIQKGDTAKAFAECRVIVERSYHTPAIEHCYLEPDAGAGYLEADGTLVIYASTQNPHYDLQEVALLLGLPESRIRIIQAATGGGFGSKLDLNVQGFIGLALYHLKRPARLVYSQQEAFLVTAKRHPLSISMKTGADKNGKLLALKARIVCDTGAYGSFGIAVVSRSAVHATGPYEIENVEIESLCTYTNNPFSGAMRGFGVPQVAFAHESQMDLLAGELHMDPLAIRKMNALKIGSTTATGQKLSASVGIGECFDAIQSHYDKMRKSLNTAESSPYLKRGAGIGSMWYGIGNTGVQNPSSAKIEMQSDGRVRLFTGAADIGQGSSTILKQIAAETLGIVTDRIELVVADTQMTSNAGATSASRQTYISGNAVKEAAEKLKDVLITEAADVLKTAKAELTVAAGYVAVSKDPERKAAFEKLAQRARRKGIPLEWQGYFDPVTTSLDPASGQGVPYATYAFACQLALVSVNILTGQVRVEKIVAAHDVGKAIHPEGVKGQIYGGIAMGLGFALMEEYAAGQTTSMKDYHIPTCRDMPEIVPIIIESTEPTGPFGAKGVGEPALIPTAPAILNALAHALGERIYHLPANLERVLETSIQSGCFGPEEVKNV